MEEFDFDKYMEEFSIYIKDSTPKEKKTPDRNSFKTTLTITRRLKNRMAGVIIKMGKEGTSWEAFLNHLIDEYELITELIEQREKNKE